MKGFLCACLLVLLQSTPEARAYEGDVHYSATYVLARAAGWSEADALIIASANQGVDENQDTVAALEVETNDMSSVHQADKNLRFHCFSGNAGRSDEVSADVLDVIAGHFAKVPAGDETPRKHARRLIALGAALHCQQDAYSHAGFAGTCGSYPGSCYGHTYQTFFDQVVFSVLEKHLFDPDHPGVSGQRVLEALRGTASELAARGPGTRSIPANDLLTLSDALRGSGLELPDAVRRDCNRYIAGKWLFDFFQARGRTPGRPDGMERLAPEIAVTCKNASLASAMIVRIPDPRYPRLKADASPSLVRADGSYELVRDDGVGDSMPSVHVAGMVQLSHWSQLLALRDLAAPTRAY